jgi:hypothetical protein
MKMKKGLNVHAKPLPAYGHVFESTESIRRTKLYTKVQFNTRSEV